MQLIKFRKNLFFKLNKAKNLSKLIKKTIVNKKGFRQTVYVRMDEEKFKLNENQIKKFIESIRNEKIEHNLCLDSSGNVLAYKTGTKDKVIFTKRELRKINNAKVSIHNHTNGSSFSIFDLKFLIINNIKEIQVVTFDDNKKINYSLHLFSEIKNKDIDSLIDAYIKISKETFIEIEYKKYKNQKEKDEEIKNFYHLAMKNFVKKYNKEFRYEKSERA